MIRVTITYGDIRTDARTDAGYNPDILDDLMKHAQTSFVLAMSQSEPADVETV